MIATPGRINDFIETGDMTLKNVGFVVLDEADRMLDMGFEPQVRFVLEAVKEERQTMMFSATWPEEVQELAQEFLGDFTFMKIGSVDLCANKNIHQEVCVTTKDYKIEQFLMDMEQKDRRVAKGGVPPVRQNRSPGVGVQSTLTQGQGQGQIRESLHS